MASSSDPQPGAGVVGAVPLNITIGNEPTLTTQVEVNETQSNLYRRSRGGRRGRGPTATERGSGLLGGAGERLLFRDHRLGRRRHVAGLHHGSGRRPIPRHRVEAPSLRRHGSDIVTVTGDGPRQQRGRTGPEPGEFPDAGRVHVVVVAGGSRGSPYSQAFASAGGAGRRDL